MLSTFTNRFHNFIWFLIFTFTLYSVPHFETLLPYKLHIFFPEAEAAQAQDESQTESSDTKEATPSEEATTPPVTSLAAGDGMGMGAGLGISIPAPENIQFMGAVTSRIPIVVPPGRSGVAPNISLLYNNRQPSGWVGVGWNLDMGAIQRSTKWGLN